MKDAGIAFQFLIFLKMKQGIQIKGPSLISEVPPGPQNYIPNGHHGSPPVPH